LEGFVDAYYGPPELKAEVQAGEPRPLPALADDAQRLLAAVEEGGYDPQRQDFLWRQARAMAAVVRNLSGDRLEFVEEVEQYFDIRPEMVPEETFETAHAELEQVVPGQGALPERMAAWRRGLELAQDRIMPVFELARRETRRRTVALFDLPAGEDVTLQLVKDQPGSGYNWYLGDFRSRIELNTDLPTRVSSAIPLLAHEAYPGHHTEHALKEARLVRDKGWAEFTVQLLLAPECVLSEGIANSARRVIFSDEDLSAFLRDELYPAGGLAGVDVEVQQRIEHAGKLLRGVGGNAALLLHRDGRPAHEVQQYIQHYGLATPQEAAKCLSFIQPPLYRSYVFNYSVGEAMLEPLLEGPQTVDNFRRLLTEPFTPAQVRQWLAEQS
jgi:hypothetical protein